jgi:hypothetical protein
MLSGVLVHLMYTSLILDGLVGYAGPKFKKKPNHMGLVTTKAIAKY